MRTRDRWNRLVFLSVLAGLALSFAAVVAQAQTAAPEKKTRAYTKPVSSIMVKVMPAGKLAPEVSWTLKAHDADSCTAWVNGARPNVAALELVAFGACRKALDAAVDAAHAAAERGVK